jgi:hypothetical protein
VVDALTASGAKQSVSFRLNRCSRTSAATGRAYKSAYSSFLL